jgi:hypothetical protein
MWMGFLFQNLYTLQSRTEENDWDPAPIGPTGVDESGRRRRLGRSTAYSLGPKPCSSGGGRVFCNRQYCSVCGFLIFSLFETLSFGSPSLLLSFRPPHTHTHTHP